MRLRMDRTWVTDLLSVTPLSFFSPSARRTCRTWRPPEFRRCRIVEYLSARDCREWFHQEFEGAFPWRGRGWDWIPEGHSREQCDQGLKSQRCSVRFGIWTYCDLRDLREMCTENDLSNSSWFSKQSPRSARLFVSIQKLVLSRIWTVLPNASDSVKLGGMSHSRRIPVWLPSTFVFWFWFSDMRQFYFNDENTRDLSLSLNVSQDVSQDVWQNQAAHQSNKK